MFSYAGRKKRLAGFYPAPRYDTIIEPFAGSAAYSLHGDNWKKKVIIRDIYPVVISIWLWLQQASPTDIDNLPDKLVTGRPVPNLQPIEAKWFFAFWCNQGAAFPRNVAGTNNGVARRPNWWPRIKEYTKENLERIRHWDIKLASFNTLKNQEATWFIDPPYQSGIKYKCDHPMNYDSLGKWAESRKGQVIVCEQSPARWLPFKLLRKHENQRGTMREELIYTR